MVLGYVFLASCKQQKGTDTDGEGPFYKGRVLPGLEHAIIRPPINILSESNEHGNYDVILNYGDPEFEELTTANLLEIDFSAGEKLNLEDYDFDFEQLHFHGPSLHLIDGKASDLEMDVVMRNPNRGIDEEPEYLVVAILFNTGEEDRFLQELLELQQSNEEPQRELQLNMLLGGRAYVAKANVNLDGFYKYSSKLASPPYSESVNWYVVRRIFTASPRQIKALTKESESGF